jgi:hypothetical protein
MREKCPACKSRINEDAQEVIERVNHDSRYDPCTVLINGKYGIMGDMVEMHAWVDYSMVPPYYFRTRLDLKCLHCGFEWDYII